MFPPWHKHWTFAPYRKWVLHVWELQGPQESRPEQLEAQYQEQPVFAMLSGLVPGSWQPVRDFCEGFEIPCLFPITDLPVIDELCKDVSCQFHETDTLPIRRGYSMCSDGRACYILPLAAETRLANNTF